MGWLSGMLSGYMDRHHHYEKQARDDAEQRAKYEESIYKTLLSHEDPNIQRMAGAGILELGKPRRRGPSGLNRFVGEMQTSPTYALLEKYFQEPQFKQYQTPPSMESATAGRVVDSGLDPATGDLKIPGQPTVPPISGAIPQTPGSAAQPTTTPTQGGAMTPVTPVPTPQVQPPPVPPPMAAAPADAMPGPPPAPPSAMVGNMGVPSNQLQPPTGEWQYPKYPDSVDLQRRELMGEADTWGQMFGKAGYPDPEKAGVEAVLAQHTRTTGAPYQAIAVEYEDETGRTVTDMASFNKYRNRWESSSGEPIVGRNVRRARPALDLGDYLETASKQLYNKRSVDLQPAELNVALARANELRAQASYATSTGTGNAAFQKPIDIATSQTTQQPVGTRPSDLAPGVQPTPANPPPAPPGAAGATPQAGVTVPRVPTDIQRKALAFYDRSQQAEDQLQAANPLTPNTPGLEDRIAAQGMFGQIQTDLPFAWMQSEDQQAYRAYQRAFTEARLRAESGAAVPPHEYTNDERTYFFVPGNTPQIMAQKRAMRQVVIDGLGEEAGPAYQLKYGQAYVPRSPNTPGRAPQLAAPPPVPPGGAPAQPAGPTKAVPDGRGGWMIVEGP